MEFSTYIVEPNPDKRVVVVTYATFIFVAGIVITYVAGWFVVTTVLFVITVLMVLFLAIVKKGNIQAIVLSQNKLIITPNSISMAAQHYDIAKIKALSFRIHSYAGMDYGRGFMVRTSNGMDNYVSFISDDQTIQCRFYINSTKHAQLLGQVFKEWYVQKIAFAETDRSGNRTYLFRQLDGKALEEFRQKYGC